MYSPATDVTSLKNVKVLVVEDVDFNLTILNDILAQRGWQAVAAASGEAALDILAEDCDFQIILMDIGLPGIDGMETTRRIKENSACRAIPVIALTAETATERERLLAAGFDGYAEKNFDPEQLFAAIDNHLRPACENEQGTEPISAPPAENADLDFEALLTTYTDENILCRIAKAFFVDTGKQILILGEAMAAKDQTQILACCHSIMGSSSIFTAKKLASATKELDACVRQGKNMEAESAWHKVQAAHASVREAATRRLNLSL